MGHILLLLLGLGGGGLAALGGTLMGFMPWLAPVLPLVLKIRDVAGGIVKFTLGGIGDLFTRPRALVVAVSIAGLCFVGGGIYGKRQVKESWRAANAAADLARVRRDNQIKQKTAAEVAPLLDAQRQRAADAERKVKDYEEKLEKRQAAVCRRGAAATRRLRQLLAR